MPELPEVETLKNGLKTVLIGQKLASVQINKPKMWRGLSSDQLVNQTIQSIDRLAKMLVINWSNNLTLIVHLKMTGQLIFVDKAGEEIAGGHPDDQFVAKQPSKYTHIIFDFLSGDHLYFNDMRQFGYAHLIASDQLEQEHQQIANIGVDPFVADFTPEYLFKHFQDKPKTSVKQVIMDQSVVAGIGNIYADESLFEAKIAPTRPAKSITEVESTKLHQAIINILKLGINLGGTSYKDYVHHDGKKGTMQDHLKVYRRGGLPCVECGGKISRITIGGRGTHFCPHCQK
ncbi:MAG: bifunctional DNA-formamidopyrimidine glycosylase/DNA-(apurinic or apyrimidinic site) lyase [Patescibacteria group bacterium]|jgi:formamidopyrimidine-DNA glycosylase